MTNQTAKHLVDYKTKQPSNKPVMQSHPHHLTSRVKLLQKAVLIHRQQLLILKKEASHPYRPNLWDLPGGNAEWPKDTTKDIYNPHLRDLIREVVEETNIEVAIKQITNRPIFAGTYFEADNKRYSVILGWRIDLPDNFERQDVRLSEEHTDQAWISGEDFDQYQFGFAGEEGGFIRLCVDAVFS